MPLLFSLAVHNSLCDVKRLLLPGEHLFAFLDDVYAICMPERTRAVYDLLSEKLLAGAGIRLHTGKTRVWNQAGECSPGMGDFPPEVWSPEGMKILGTPVGTEEFEDAACEECIEEEEKLWNAIHWIPDLQCAWQVLVQCAGPRCHHLLRTMPPSRSSTYAQAHDAGMQQAMQSFLGELPGAHSNNRLRVSWHHCQCAWGFWVFVRQPSWQHPLSGHLGPMHCRCSKSGCPSLQLRSSWTCPLIQLGVWGSCKKHPTCWTIVVSLGVQHGKTCVEGKDQVRTKPSPVSGRTVGSTSRLPLVNNISGRPLFSLNRAPLTRRPFDHTLEQVLPTFCVDVLLDLSDHRGSL